MDRPRFSRLANDGSVLFVYLWPLALVNLALILSIFAPFVQAESSSSLVANSSSANASAISNPGLESSQKEPEYSTGVFYGHIIKIDLARKVISALSSERMRRRKEFYVDSKTEFYVDGKRSRWSDTYLADKVAIRFFSADKTSIAEAVYVVFGDFEPEKYLPKKGKKHPS